MIEIVEQEGDVYEFRASTTSGIFEVITEAVRQGDDLILIGLHITGPGPHRSGIAELRQLARELGRLFGARQVVILGGIRTTGANPDHRPRPVTITVGD